MKITKFIYHATQVEYDDSGEWLLKEDGIKEEFEVDAISETEALNLGTSKLSKLHPTVPLSYFILGVSYTRY